MTDSDPQTPPGARISRESPVAMEAAGKANAAMSRELRTLFKRDGAEAALGHANGAVLAATMFMAYDIGQPDVARSTVSYWARRVDDTTPAPPPKTDEPPVPNMSPETLAAKWADDATAWLWDAHRQLDPEFSLTLAEATVRASLRFLVSTYAEGRARALVDGLRAELDAMVAARDAEVTATRQ